MDEHQRQPLNRIDLSVLFVSYNRSDLLETSIRSVQERLEFGGLRVEYLVTDDASDNEHALVIKALPVDKRLLWPVNTGLGANCNRGLGACRGEYILQVQDDCEFVGTPSLLLTSLDIFRADPEVGIVQLTNQTPGVQHVVRHLGDGTPYWVFANDGEPRPRACGDRPYSDQPHVKRKQFAIDVGRYDEGVPMTSMEIGYQQRVACQTKWRVAHLPRQTSFRHLGAERSFNPSLLRARRLRRLECLPIIGPAFKHSRPRLRALRDLLRSTETEAPASSGRHGPSTSE